MKETSLMLMVMICLSGKNLKTSNQARNHYTYHENDTILEMHKLKKLFVVGDFDGDKKKDTIFQHNYSRASKVEIHYSPNPYKNDWEKIVKWFYDQESDVFLAFGKKNKDTLHLGTAHGLYCLINVGDTNLDGKDEIAFVIDYLDYSRVNSCDIYSLCKGKWNKLKSFGVHEGSFDFYGEKSPIFKNIKGNLEKQKGKWVYLDYLQDGWDSFEEIGKMKPLKLEKCD